MCEHIQDITWGPLKLSKGTLEWVAVSCVQKKVKKRQNQKYYCHSNPVSAGWRREGYCVDRVAWGYKKISH